MCDSAGRCVLSDSGAIESAPPSDPRTGDAAGRMCKREDDAEIRTGPGALESSLGFAAAPNNVERAPKLVARAVSLPATASARRSRFQRQPEASDTTTSSEIQEKGSITPAMRKKYLKDLFMNYNSYSGLSTILSHTRCADPPTLGADEGGASSWVLDPTEHAWMLSIVDGNHDTLSEYLSEDPSLLARKDFVSGYTALHWLAKQGKHETLLKLLKNAERNGSPVNVNLKGSGGLTPLHVAAMHSQYMVIKILVGAFSARVDAMDYNGKRAWQYLKENAPEEMKELLGAWDDLHTSGQLNANNNNAAYTEGAASDNTQKDTKIVDTVTRNSLWSFGSFRKLLSPFFSRAKN